MLVAMFVYMLMHVVILVSVIVMMVVVLTDGGMGDMDIIGIVGHK